MSNKVLTVLRVAVFLVCLVLYTFSYVIYGKTLVWFWTPVIASVVVSIVSMPFLAKRWSWLTTFDNKIVNIICHLFVTGCIVYSAFLLGNYYLSNESSAYTEKVTVESKEKVKRSKSRRVGRRRYVADGYRYEYYITVKCDGVLKELNVSSKIYGRTRAGYPVELEMKDGLLGFPVVVKVNAVSSML